MKLALLLALLGLTATISDSFDSYPRGIWEQGSTHGGWYVDFNGYGQVEITRASGHGNVLQLAPKASTQPSETHAALVTSTGTFGDLTYSVQARTVTQLRTGSPPNPWETDWITWHHNNTPDGATFYYLALKTNGWELGKEDYAYPGGQRFLATGTAPANTIGGWHSYQIRQVGNVIDVSVNGTQLASFTDTERPYLSGKVGLYTEDAQVQFDNAVVAAAQ